LIFILWLMMLDALVLGKYARNVATLLNGISRGWIFTCVLRDFDFIPI